MKFTLRNPCIQLPELLPLLDTIAEMADNKGSQRWDVPSEHPGACASRAEFRTVLNTMFTAMTFLAALLFTSGGAFMKSSVGLTRPWPTVACMLCFVGGAALQGLAMRGNPMGVTHIFVLGLEAVLALALGAMLFDEALSLPKVGGAGLIVLGMILLRYEPRVA